MSSATWLQPSQAGLDAARVSIPGMGEYKTTHFNGVSFGINDKRDGLQAIALFDLPDVDVPTVSTPQACDPTQASH
ncbi:hypothetical protein MVLG_04454 [Microbotryum lychnidis-dioicae p1A1 Lamole]|uniref:Uncharacterized protein n=1 Tax=Microbotryum lychnidis-dioicae (strain p1A1 Lamole / MvSl-1064) TaxID=683840 RepID=U5HBA0_USTV1|nr:hypothetical protein MVLG_04454 [Microbotryum lychnidis-dioicae p1A1 Lamole]|eukprot:KDE05111.1 hypothetical protein MVLG_04454 [Microbotryum lychnidis-dioicae p1A1 Lamole]